MKLLICFRLQKDFVMPWRPDAFGNCGRNSGSGMGWDSVLLIKYGLMSSCRLFVVQRPALSLDRKDSISRPESTASTTVSTPSLHSPSSPTSEALSSLPCCSPLDASADGRGSRASSDDTGSVTLTSGGFMPVIAKGCHI